MDDDDTHGVSHRYPRVLLKISGESLMGKQAYGIDPEMVATVACEVRDVVASGVETCLVIGGGNIFRGVSGAAAGMERATGDYMGMLATVTHSKPSYTTCARTLFCYSTKGVHVHVRQ